MKKADGRPPHDFVQALVLRSGGEMGALMRAFDWTSTPLGPVETWPASLRTAVSILLTTRHPMFLWWGPELIQFYNDDYRHSLGPDRHPSALGQRGRECWAEIWPVIGPEVESIMAGGDATWHEDFLIPITRGDRVEDVYWSYSYSPVQDDNGGVGGVLVTVQETTQRVIAERRKQLLRELGDQVETGSVDEVGASAAATLEQQASVVSFALVYFRDRESGAFRLAGRAGMSPESRLAPGEIPAGRDAPWPLATALADRNRRIIGDVPRTIGRIDRDPWSIPVREAAVLPIILDGAGPVEGMLIAGANPQQPLDQSYEAFLIDLARVLSTALSRVRAREQERRTEQQLRDVERLQSVGALAGGVAHEVNNQMTVVLGFGEFVLNALGADHPQAADMRLVLLAGHRAAKVSQQLLTFSRRQLTQPRVLELHTVTTGLEPVLRQLLGSDKTLVVKPGHPTSFISADPTQIDQVLINLVANARDATPTGGRVTISVEDVDLPQAASARYGVSVVPGRYVLLTVADTGHGMDRATAARIFEPFFTTKPVGQGTGLGLSMVYGIVKRHEGYVWAESTPGLGTIMRLYWPAITSASTAVITPGEHRVAADLPPDDRVRTVWVVEDEAAVRDLVARTLSDVGFRVVTAEDGAEALRLLEEERITPTLMVTDLVLPHVNGRQVSEAVTALYPEIPVLFMSGYAGDDVVRRGLMPENAAFLQKPFTPAELVDALETVLARIDGVSAR